MKTRFSANVFFVTVLFLLTAVSLAKAQSNFVLHAFGLAKYSGTNASTLMYTNGDGAYPNGWLTLSGTNFYGTTQSGGTNGSGTLFAVSTNGAFRLLYTFQSDTNYGNTSGANPNGGLALSGTNLYGSTYAGGANDSGVIFSVSTNGTSIKTLYAFSDNSTGANSDGANSCAGLVIAGSTLCGTAEYGGAAGGEYASGCGVVFSYDLNKGFKVLHLFPTANYDITSGNYTNGDGANPTCRLLLLGTNLFGTTPNGGTNGLGTIFKVSTNGTGFAGLHHFDDNDANGDHGAQPNAGLVYSGGRLFGMGGIVVYSIATNGTGFTVLESVGGAVDNTELNTSGLIVSNGTLYGMINGAGAGAYQEGQLFALTTNGIGFADFHDFTFTQNNSAGTPTNFDGILPSGAPVLLNGLLFGSASQGGTNGSGVIFQASPPPMPLSCQLSDTNFVFSFQTFDGLSYTVQNNTNLVGSNWILYSNFMGNSTIKQFVVPATNSSQLYFRLRQP